MDLDTIREIKSSAKLEISLWLLGTCFTVFALIVSLRPTLLQDSNLIAYQLALAIPLFLGSILASAKLSYSKNLMLWEYFVYATFIIAYSLLINVVGLSLAWTISERLGIVFLVFNILVAVCYSIVDVMDNNSKLKERIEKDLFFVLLILFGGILPILGILKF